MTSEALPSLTHVPRRVRLSSLDDGTIVMTTNNDRLYTRLYNITIIVHSTAALTLRTHAILLLILTWHALRERATGGRTTLL